MLLPAPDHLSFLFDRYTSAVVLRCAWLRITCTLRRVSAGSRVIRSAAVRRTHDLRQAVDHPVAVERGVVVGDGIDALPLVRLPIDDDTAHYRLPPTLGEHTGEVLREAGFTEVEIAQLTAEPARI